MSEIQESCPSHQETKGKCESAYATASQDTEKPQRDDWHTSYRVRAIPSALDLQRLSDVVINIFQLEKSGFKIHSLATDVASQKEALCKTATVSFQQTPSLLKGRKDDLHSVGITVPYTVTDLDASQHLVFDTHFLGFTPLSPWEHDQKHTVTCIFIHGWGGHAIGSFTSPMDSHAWPRDSLPYHIPELQVLTYGYGSRLTDSKSHEDLYTYAAKFKDHLRLLQEGAIATNHLRPIIFIVHSLGGWVFKRTLARMHARPEMNDGTILQCIHGALFFGVPGQGMEMKALAKMVEGTPHEVTARLLNHSQGFQLRNDEQEDFSSAFSHKDGKVTYFFEQRESKTVVMDTKTGEYKRNGPEVLLVSQISATYGRDWTDRICGLDRDHFGIVKFSKFDMEYDIVKKVIQNMSKNAAGIVTKRMQIYKGLPEASTSQSSRTNQQACLQSLFFREMTSRSKEIDIAASNTCTWILNNITYQQWSTQSCGLVWIKGKPGAGKSTILKYILESPHVDTGQPWIVLSFFFHGRGAPIQRSELGLLRSLLHQLAQQIPNILLRLTDEYMRRCEACGKYEDKWFWEVEDLKTFVRSYVSDVANTYRIRIYVDALDECGEKAATDLVNFFKSIRTFCTICFSCRHYPIISLGDENLEICVEENNSKDIETYLDYRMEEAIPYQKLPEFAAVRHHILSNGSGVFQWVRLVTEILLKSRKQGKDLKTIREEIQALPPTLDDLYHQLLGGLDSSEKPQTLKLIQWIYFARRPITLHELRIAMAIDSNIEYTQLRQCQESEGFAKTSDAMRVQVLDLSRGLVEFVTHDDTPSVAQFVHQSVTDYLRERGLDLLDDAGGWAPNGTLRGRSHFRLLRSCINYLHMEELRDFDLPELARTQKMPTRHTLRRAVSKKFPLLLYAASSWIEHFQRVEEEGIPQGDFISLYYSHSPLPLGVIDTCRKVHKDDDVQWQLFRPGTTSLSNIASRYNLLSLFMDLISQGFRVDSKEGGGGTALSNAVEYSSLEILRVLLRYSWIDLNSTAVNGQAPLNRAAEVGSERIVRTLLQQSRVNQNLIDNYGRTPLICAADAGNKTIVSILLEQECVDRNARDKTGRTALSRAAGEGYEPTVRLLLSQEDVDRGLEDDSGRTALAWASERGHEGIVRLLSTQDRASAQGRASAQDRAEHGPEGIPTAEGFLTGLLRGVKNALYFSP